MASEKLCVRWNDFESNISVAFRDLREAKELFNVTLACDEDQIQAHKVLHLAKIYLSQIQHLSTVWIANMLDERNSSISPNFFHAY